MNPRQKISTDSKKYLIISDFGIFASMNKAFKIRSSISSELMRKILFRGFILSFFGMIFLILAAIFIPKSEMQTWGWIIFLISFAFIPIGLLPYRRLSRLQLHPNELVQIDEEDLIYISKGKRILKIPLISVNELNYIDDVSAYGIGVSLKTPPVLPVIVYDLSEGEKLYRKGRKVKMDLFFPYFNHRAYVELMLWIKSEPNE